MRLWTRPLRDRLGVILPHPLSHCSHLPVRPRGGSGSLWRRALRLGGALLLSLLLLGGLLGQPAGGLSGVQAQSDPLEELLAALQAQAQAPSFRVAETVSGPGGTVEYQLAYAAPDRFHLVGSDGSEAIVVGSDLYPRGPDGSWVLGPGAGWGIAARFIGLREPALVEQFRQTAREVRVGGVEEVEGAPARVYQYATLLEGVVSGRSDLTVWVGLADGLPRQVEVAATTVLPEETVSTHSLLRFRDYQAEIAIEPPF